ncbi:MAG: TonB-dependent receptor [Saprospiraceae bacterium]|nr:TonB-dependent receptor [Saprospiraceae bacterium]
MRKFARYKASCGPLASPFFFLTLFFQLLPAPRVSAQSDSLLALREVEIRSAGIADNGYSIWKLDSLPVLGNVPLSERLLWENAADVRPNAPGTLATLSIRGAGSRRTPVFWNGLPLQSPMNGVIDLALIPAWVGDELSVQYGGQSAAQSSGSLGGSIRLISRPFQQQTGMFGELSQAWGSWGQRETSVQAGWANARYNACLRSAWQQADNNFPFQNTAQLGAPKVRQVNNFGKTWNLEQHNQLIVNTKNNVKSGLWLQRAFREIPPTMTQTPEETWQRDRNLRAFLTWEHRLRSSSVLQTQVAWLDEGLYFFLHEKTDSSRAKTFRISSDWMRQHNKRLLLKGGLLAQRQWARVGDYVDSTHWYTQTRAALYASGERMFSSGRISIMLRQEWAEAQGAPFTWSVGGQFHAGPGLLHFHLARNFNLPVFNDLYWADYGRADLKPEKGYSGDLGWKFSKSAFSADVTVFQLLMDDWIEWAPGPDGIFVPFNLKKVWSRGISLNGAWRGSYGPWKGTLSGNYQYAKASNQAVYAGEPAILHHQLIYTPNHSAGLSIKAERHHFSVAYLHQFTGSRFVTSDNLQTIKGFQTGNLLCNYHFPIKTTRFSLGLRISNIWNTPYQVLQYRPMPGRGWRLEGNLAF